MEHWKDPNVLIIWGIYIVLAVSILSAFAMFLVRQAFVKETQRKEEVARLKESHLNEMLSKHAQTQEIERERIGVDLHDEVSNRLNVILLRYRMQNDPEKVEQEINDAIVSVRNLAHNLNPPMLAQFSLKEHVFDQVDKFDTKYKVNKWYIKSKDLEWSNEQKIQVIRIIQEVMNNIVKHAEATMITVKIRERSNGLIISVADNGKGIAVNKKGMGMENIQNRIFLVNGICKVKSTLGKGTNVLIGLPYEI